MLLDHTTMYSVVDSDGRRHKSVVSYLRDVYDISLVTDWGDSGYITDIVYSSVFDGSNGVDC
jgi:predicted heme/steroid binding protein